MLKSGSVEGIGGEMGKLIGHTSMLNVHTSSFIKRSTSTAR